MREVLEEPVLGLLRLVSPVARMALPRLGEAYRSPQAFALQPCFLLVKTPTLITGNTWVSNSWDAMETGILAAIFQGSFGSEIQESSDEPVLFPRLHARRVVFSAQRSEKRNHLQVGIAIA